MAVDAVLSAICVVLGYVSLEVGSDFKFTFENLPVIIGAMMFGPVDGMLIGLVGTFLYQLIRYGLEPSTVLWIVPYVLSGLFVGLVSRAFRYNMKIWQIIILMLLNGLLVTGINTACLYIYYKFILLIPTETLLVKLPLKLGISAIKAVAYSFLVPLLIMALKKAHIYEVPKAAVKEKESDHG